MVLAVLVHQSVSVIHPAIRRCVVVDGAELFAVGSVKSVGQLNVFPSHGIACQVFDNERVLFGPGVQWKGHSVVHLVHGQTHVHRGAVEHYLCFGLLLLDGQNSVFGSMVDIYYGECVAWLVECERAVA